MRITVLMGGSSSERDVSLASGVRVVGALRSLGHQVTPVDPAVGVLEDAAFAALASGGVRQAPPTLTALNALAQTELSPVLATMPAIRNAEVVFLALHGGQGEDGTIQAMLRAADVRFTGSGPLASALAMDKDLSKTLFRAAGVTTADWLMAPVNEDEVERVLGWPVIVKPSKQGSTVGLTLVKERAAFAEAVALASNYDDEVMVEQFIPGREFTVGILGDLALPVGEIIPAHELYDYECKYTPGMAREEFPAALTASQTADVQQQARDAFRALKLSGYARIDFRMLKDGTFYCLEANTLPGMTELSLIPQAAAAHGISFPELCEQIVRLAMAGPGRGTQR
ncbi:MAG: D-alanine--D-alanine ligase [Gemmatimonadaceae bacterium]|nr:D-alanine--D-alanine ligase [Gemmatimonadaceae bacterium]